MKKKNGINYSMHPDVIARRKGALERLEAQLKSGKKNTRDEYGNHITVRLNESDIIRIKKEIDILSKRIQS